MDSNNCPPAQNGAPPPMNGHESHDWRSHLLPESRERIINKIMETLKRHLPYSGQEGLQELKQVAIRFEEKICSAATSQSDYLRKISLKMLTMESRSQNSLPNASPSNSSSTSRNPQEEDLPIDDLSIDDLSIDEAEQPPQRQQPQHTTPINEEH